MANINRQITLAARPEGFPKESDFASVESPVPTPGEGQFLVRTQFLSVDPYMRGRMNGVRTYADPFEIGDVMGGRDVGNVVASNHPEFNEGDTVMGKWGWQDYALSDGAEVQRVFPELAPIQTALGVLGMPGLTAYFGLLDICDPQPGETVFISGAAGAVGAVVGQIAKIKGCRVVGSAGTDEKVAHLIDDCGFDAAFNYKKDTDYSAKLHELCPKGINVYFDNVGGAITDAALLRLAERARVSLCGEISQYNLKTPEMGPRLMVMLLIRQAKAEGFIITRFAERYPEGVKQLAQWVSEGKIKYREDIMEGLENAPAAFIRMLKGENKGKQLVKV